MTLHIKLQKRWLFCHVRNTLGGIRKHCWWNSEVTLETKHEKTDCDLHPRNMFFLFISMFCLTSEGQKKSYAKVLYSSVSSGREFFMCGKCFSIYPGSGVYTRCSFMLQTILYLKHNAAADTSFAFSPLLKFRRVVIKIIGPGQ